MTPVAMPRKTLALLVFLAGLAVLCWIGASHAGTSPLAAAVTAVIAACYLAGALELHRYRQATATLEQALADLATPPAGLADWLGRLDPGLRHSVRLRVEGERAALPGPALTPYLVGLLVLLGMLGTLLGMMATLRGTGLALESASDLQAVRASLAAPVKGLGFAFGTSIAGVAASATLGLLSALCRRERQQAVQRLDAAIATTLRPWSQAWQREEAFRLLQQQAATMPTLVERLQAMVEAVERQNAAAGERLAAGQQEFHARTEAAQARLAATLEHALKEGVADSARAVGATLQPVVETTLAGLARESAALHGRVEQAVQRQLDGLSAGFAEASAGAAGAWTTAMTAQRQSNEALAQDLRGALDGFADTFAQRSGALLDGIAARLDGTAGGVAAAWTQALAQQQAANEAMAARHEQALTAAAAAVGQQGDALVQAMDHSHAGLQASLAAQDRDRLDAWTATLAATADRLHAGWERAGEQVAQRQQAICDTLAQTAGDISVQAQAHARDTIAEISRLVQAASEAPRAAAEVIAGLRQTLSDSMVRDTAMLEERVQLMGTLQTLLDAVNHASTEQRTAIDALVATSADLLERVGTRFTAHVEAETGKLGAVSAQLAAGAAEVASLGEAFGAAVQRFGASNDDLAARLLGIEGALEKSLARSDDQLAYYVAQAREVIDLSLLAQRQIVEDLRRIGGPRADAGAEAA